MACTPTHCDYYSTGTTTCVGYRSSCSTNRPLSFYISEGPGIYAYQIEEFRNAIRAEIDLYNNNYMYSGAVLLEPNPVYSGNIVTTSVINNIDDMIHQVYGGAEQGRSSGLIIDDVPWASLIDQYNIVRQNCICNSDCSCNYVCACYGDCGCNY